VPSSSQAPRDMAATPALSVASSHRGAQASRRDLHITQADVSGMQQQIEQSTVDSVKRKYRFQQFNANKGLLQLALLRRTRFYIELVRYLAFLALLFVVLWAQPVHYPFERNSAIRDVFGGTCPGVRVRACSLSPRPAQ
jgi:hypothetical protein